MAYVLQHNKLDAGALPLIEATLLSGYYKALGDDQLSDPLQIPVKAHVDSRPSCFVYLSPGQQLVKLIAQKTCSAIVIRHDCNRVTGSHVHD